ncbi:hypothetical protein B0J18DRAFT_238567 [Chaetomium sp. MPI-SDFR-AT-0129]|nr:hypothetical protein B0J18DRAFT_238567 [Chaetomium sp. MPI-SDFR-AT-0129]
MSDTLNLNGLVHGRGMDRKNGHSSVNPVQYAPHKYSADERAGSSETASISTSSESDLSDFFDFPAYYGGDGETDVTTPSDAPSPVTNTPELRPAGYTPTRVVDHDGDTPMSDAPSDHEEVQLPLIWPNIPGPHPRRDSSILLEGSLSPPSSPSSSAASPPTSPTVLSPAADMRLDVRPLAVAPQHKTRILKDRRKTSNVRKIGSCYYCKMSKQGCGEGEVCAGCSKRPCPDRACIRTSLSKLTPTRFFRWNWNNSNPMQCRDVFTGGGMQNLFISCSESIESRCVRLEAVAPPNPTDFEMKGQRPRWEVAIQQWVEQQIRADKRTDFEAEMDKLLLELDCRRRAGGRDNKGQLLEPLLSKIFSMRCMWRIWSCERLVFRERPGSPPLPFDDRFELIQDSLRVRTGRRISELEREIISELEVYIAQKEPKEVSPGPKPTRGAAPVIKWVLLWHMMLLYRQSIHWLLEQQQTKATTTADPDDSGRHTFRENTQRLFEAIVVIYSAVFQKATTVARTKDASPQVFEEDRELYAIYQRAWRALPEFCKSLPQPLPREGNEANIIR